MSAMIDYALPSAVQWSGLAGVLLGALFFTVLGRLAGVPDRLPETALISGWAILAAVLTVTGVFSGLPFAYPFWAMAAVSALAFGVLARRGGVKIPSDTLKILALGLPLLVIVTAKWPSEVDTFTHWLPNAEYIVANDSFPRPGLPAPWSSYPGFPYNFSFVSYVVGQFAGRFVENAAIVFNVVLLLAFAALLARLIRRAGPTPDAPIGWGLAALSILLATLANPVFVRKIVLISYPDLATSVVLAFAGVLAWMWLDALAERRRDAGGLAVALTLALVLLINIKQANLVLFLALVISLAVIVWRDPKLEFRPFLRWLPFLLAAPLAIYVAWRFHLSHVMPLNEAKLLPVDKWAFEKLPHLLFVMGTVVLKKGHYFAIMAFFLVWSLRAVIRPRGSFDRLALIVAGLFTGYTVFLAFIFIVHFGGYPQSYWRINTHLGYFGLAAFIYGLARLYHLRFAEVGERLPMRQLAVALIVAVPLLQVATAGYWRFDLQEPKPTLRGNGLDLARTLPADAILVAYIPGDNGNFSWILRYYVTTARPDLRVVLGKSVKSTVETAGKPTDRPIHVWSYCGTSDLGRAFKLKLPTDAAILLSRANGGWRVVRTWPRTEVGRAGYHKNFDPKKCAAGT